MCAARRPGSYAVRSNIALHPSSLKLSFILAAG